MARLFYGWVVVAGAFVVLFVAYAAQYSFGVFFAALLDEFGWSRASLAGGRLYGRLGTLDRRGDLRRHW